MSKLAAILGALFVCTGSCVAFFQAMQMFVDSGKQLAPLSSQPSFVNAPTGTRDFAAERTVASGTIGWNERGIVPPLDGASERITKKPFGIRVTPANSPVSPERFSGYHTGTDFETFSDEQEKDVQVYAICEGVLLRAGTASGYGGYAIQSCVMNGQDITVIYGHLRVSSLTKKAGDALRAGEEIAVLGKGYSEETDGERKHLHLGIVKGKNANIRGYVSEASVLSSWIDYQSIAK